MIKKYFMTTLIIISSHLAANVELRDHVLNGNWALAENLIAQSTSLNPDFLMFDQDGPYADITILNFLAQKGQFDLVLQMINAHPSCHPDYGLSSETRSTVLWYASQARPLPTNLINILLTRYDNLDVNARPTGGTHRTVLEHLTIAGEQFVELINEKYPQADFNAAAIEGPLAGITPLWNVANLKHRQLFRAIIDKPRFYDFNAAEASSKQSVFNLVTRNKWWEEALEIIGKNEINILGKGDNINESGPLRLAIEDGQWDLLSKMIKKLPPSFNADFCENKKTIVMLLLEQKAYDFCALLLPKPSSASLLHWFIPTGNTLAGVEGDDALEWIPYYLLNWYHNFGELNDEVRAQFYLAGHGVTPMQIAYINYVRKLFLNAAQIIVTTRNLTHSERIDLALKHIQEGDWRLYSFLPRAFIEKILSAFEEFTREKMMKKVLQKIAESVRIRVIKFKPCKTEDSSCVMEWSSSRAMDLRIKAALQAAVTEQNLTLESLMAYEEVIIEQLALLGKKLSPRTIKSTLKLIFSELISRN